MNVHSSVLACVAITFSSLCALATETSSFPVGVTATDEQIDQSPDETLVASRLIVSRPITAEQLRESLKQHYAGVSRRAVSKFHDAKFLTVQITAYHTAASPVNEIGTIFGFPRKDGRTSSEEEHLNLHPRRLQRFVDEWRGDDARELAVEPTKAEVGAREDAKTKAASETATSPRHSHSDKAPLRLEATVIDEQVHELPGELLFVSNLVVPNPASLEDVRSILKKHYQPVRNRAVSKLGETEYITVWVTLYYGSKSPENEVGWIVGVPSHEGEQCVKLHTERIQRFASDWQERKRQEQLAAQRREQERRWAAEARALEDATAKAQAEARAAQEAREQQERERQEAERARTERLAGAVQAADLFRQFENNGIAAERYYADRRIKVIGRVQDVDRDILGNPYVALKADILGAVQCFFEESQAGELAKLNKGDVVVIEGTCRGKFFNVMLKNCELTVARPLINGSAPTFQGFSDPQEDAARRVLARADKIRPGEDPENDLLWGILEYVIKTYPNTAAGKEARGRLDKLADEEDARATRSQVPILVSPTAERAPAVLHPHP